MSATTVERFSNISVVPGRATAARPLLRFRLVLLTRGDVRRRHPQTLDERRRMLFPASPLMTSQSEEPCSICASQQNGGDGGALGLLVFILLSPRMGYNHKRAAVAGKARAGGSLMAFCTADPRPSAAFRSGS